MSGSLARIPIHRCSSVPNFSPSLIRSEPTSEPRRSQSDYLSDTWCDCSDNLFNYAPHKLCLKSKLYNILNNYLFHHPNGTASYM